MNPASTLQHLSLSGMRRLPWVRCALPALTVALTVAFAGCSAPDSAPAASAGQGAVTPDARPAVAYTFTTLDDSQDRTFNRLLGINNLGRIAGYYGSGASGHPNRGYVLYPPYKQVNFIHEDFPTGVDTQVTSVDDKQHAAGFYVDYRGRRFGFLLWKNLWFIYQDPHVRNVKGQITEIAGVNDAGSAVGFFGTSNRSTSFVLNEATGVFRGMHPAGASNSVATGINGKGSVVGYLTNNSGTVVGFLQEDKTLTQFSYPHAKATQALGVTEYDRIVGSYVDANGLTHGFLLQNPLGSQPVWQTIDNPDAAGTTVVTGINIHYTIVGYYVDSSGNTHGFLGNP